MSTHILIVEDDPDIAELVARYLEKAGYSTARAASGRDALSIIGVKAPNLLVLDLMLPHVDGLEVCRAVRANDRTAGIPIIMLTARADESERIVGLELGADDYLAKPFNPRELLARVRALLRRAATPAAEHQSEAATPRFQTGDLEIDFDARRVTVGGKSKELTRFEFELLAALARGAGRVQSRDRLMDLLKGEEFESFDRSIDVHVSRLRAKIERDPKSPRWIKTVRGVGYVLETGS